MLLVWYLHHIKLPLEVDSMKKKLVISRYNEDIGWTSMHDQSEYVIYNKGDDHLPNSIKLENVGREAHTYLGHIIANYHCLSDLLIFTQGNPFEHTKEHGLDLSKLFVVEPLGYSHLVQDMSNNRWGETMSNRDGFTIDEWKGKISNKKGYNLKGWWESTTGEPYVRSKYVFWSAIFSVKKEHILKRSLESYIKIYQTLLHDRTPVEAHYCERTWFNILRLEYS